MTPSDVLESCREHNDIRQRKHSFSEEQASVITMTADSQKVVTICYDDLVRISLALDDANAVAQDLLVKIGQAFGDNDGCLGILAVTDVPQLEPMRQKLLPMARELALLPKNELDAVTDEKSGYQVGWSHGKEKVEGEKVRHPKSRYLYHCRHLNHRRRCSLILPKDRFMRIL